MEWAFCNGSQGIWGWLWFSCGVAHSGEGLFCFPFYVFIGGWVCRGRSHLGWGFVCVSGGAGVYGPVGFRHFDDIS